MIEYLLGILTGMIIGGGMMLISLSMAIREKAIAAYKKSKNK